MADQIIQEGYAVFIHDGDKAIGAVRRAPLGGKEIRIYVENGGDFTVPLSAIQHVNDEKVVLDGNKLDATLKAAVANAHRAEDPNI